ncbi:hypothetical protein V6N11_060948 [Hibiscus sabdariffa]|uniref:GAG-pre-integrase domain-containing protein n=1 Tax=Hibiscus sabdariffa TaxID=183260 RepID=A0ABR2QS43_9ROSI
MLLQFLMELNVEYYGQLCGNILAQDPLPSLNHAIVGFAVHLSGRSRGRIEKVDKSLLLCTHCKKISHEVMRANAATAFDNVVGLSNNNTTSTPSSAFTADQWKALTSVFGNLTISNDCLNVSKIDSTTSREETSSIQAIIVDGETSSLALWCSRMGHPSEKIVKFFDDEIQPHNPIDVASPGISAPTETASSHSVPHVLLYQ